MAEELDETDWAILDRLQQDGRISLTELGKGVNLSASATTERVRRLEAAGVITGYGARVDLEKVGYPVMAVVRLKYPRQSAPTAAPAAGPAAGDPRVPAHHR